MKPQKEIPPMTQTEKYLSDESLIMKYCTFWNAATDRIEFPADNIPLMLKEYSDQQNKELKEALKELILKCELEGLTHPTFTQTISKAKNLL